MHSLEAAGSPEAGLRDMMDMEVLRLGYLWTLSFLFTGFHIETPSFACMLRKTGLCRVYFRTHFDASTIGSHTHTQYSCYTMNLKISARKCQQKPCLQLLPGSQMFESLEMALPQEACWRVEICCMRYFNVSPKLVKRSWQQKLATKIRSFGDKIRS